MPAESRALQCVIVTPERAVLDEPADFVALPMYDGELGVLPGRAPLIGRLGLGELRLRQGADVRRFYIEGGFAQVRANVVTVLTQQAQRAQDINPAAAEEALEQPLAAASPEERASQIKIQERARAQLRVARRTHESPAG